MKNGLCDDKFIYIFNVCIWPFIYFYGHLFPFTKTTEKGFKCEMIGVK